MAWFTRGGGRAFGELAARTDAGVRRTAPRSVFKDRQVVEHVAMEDGAWFRELASAGQYDDGAQVAYQLPG